jgi:hypothetical protein
MTYRSGRTDLAPHLPTRRAQIPIAPAAPWVHTSRGRLSDTGPQTKPHRRDGPASATLHINGRGTAVLAQLKKAELREYRNM